MKFFSIRLKITWALIAAVVMTVVLSGVSTFWVTKNEMQLKYLDVINEVIASAEDLVDDMISDSNAALEVVELAFKEFGDEGEPLSEDLLFKTLKLFKAVLNDATTLYFASEDGSFYHYPKRKVDPGFDPRERSWYQIAHENPGMIQWTDPYMDMGTSSLVITGSKKIEIENSDYVGVIGVDLLLSDIIDMISGVQIGKTGDLLLCNTNDQVIASKLGTKHNVHLSSYQPALLNLKDKDQYKDKDYTYFKRVMPTYRYYFIARIPNKELNALSTRIFYMILLIGLACVTLVFAIAHYFSRAITSPLMALLKTMKETEQGRYDVVCEATSNDEVGMIITGFNNAIVSINSKHEEMSTLYEALYASEEALKDQYEELYTNRELIKDSESRYKDIFEASKEGLWILEKDKHMHYISKEWYNVFNLDLNNTSLDQWQQLMHPDDVQMVNDAFEHHVKHRTNQYKTQFRVMDRTGQYRWVESVGKAKYDESDEWLRIAGSHIDITNRKMNEQKIKDLAFKDALTGVGNRVTLKEYLEHEMEFGHAGALLYIDVDNFKYINDTFGHVTGDIILKEMAYRLRRTVSNDEQIARISGDEFVVVINGVTDKDRIVDHINRLLSALYEDIMVDENAIRIRVSMGVTVYPQDAHDLTTLLRYADLAMYSAKEQVDTDYYFYDDTIQADLLERMQLENYLRSAIDYDELFLVYQPIISQPNQEIIGFESLIRWQHPNLNLISPARFIPIAEKTGMINAIGLFVLETGLRFMKRLNAKLLTQFSLSVNLSVIQLKHAQFITDVINLIDKYDYPTDLLSLEITESLELENDPDILGKLSTLRSYGIGISLDDFGSGYSSINNLLTLPISVLKLDKGLVTDAAKDKHVSALVASVISYSHQSKIAVIAEGVEESQERDALNELGVDAIQGYYYSKPIDQRDVQTFVEKWDHGVLIE